MIASKPMDASMSAEKPVVIVPSTWLTPARPTRAPAISIPMMYMLLTLMPATRAACGFSPTARNLKPEARSAEDPPHHDRRDDDEDEAEVQVVLRAEQLGEDRGVLHRRRLRVARARRLQQARRAQHPRDQVEGDVVEHDRHDHLVRAGPRLERAGDAGPQRAGDEPGDEGDDHVEAPRQIERERHPPCRGGCHQHLAAAADVEHADAERQRHAQAGRDQRGREGQRLGERTDAARERRRPEVVDRALEEREYAPQTASQAATIVSMGRAKK